jgi:ubiquinone/menaquinone biosynthesis C-methylase UbiE
MGKDRVVEAFTELAASYEETMEEELRMLWDVDYQTLIERITSLAAVEPGERALDVATGTARIPAAIARTGGSRTRLVGLDITWRMLAHGQAQLRRTGDGARVPFVCASAMAMPLASQSFDVVTCGLGMHHMDVPRALGQVHRVLADTGRLVLVTVGARRHWQAPGVRALMHGITFLYFKAQGQTARAQAEAATTSNIYTAAEWRDVLADAGFTAIEVRREFTPRHTWYPYGLVLKAEKGTRKQNQKQEATEAKRNLP